ncbi:hypothetical protein INT48_006717 [Thamnidium elegans]|uniref:GDP/GTP exchange factor Sec2 N-terminal domain-containing protein n=1 Tax=Thamnidium elegans TaxID=101142 RepID=A0A8H7VVJ9_9FUNG|nr:hypothetical protein INT48_006717 [Thamnidium elegans]
MTDTQAQQGITHFRINNELDVYSAPNINCSCQYWLVSDQSENCGLCDQVIPIVKQHHENITGLKEQAAESETKLTEKQALYKAYNNDIKSLENEHGRRQELITNMTNQIQSLNEDIEIVQLKHKDEIAHTIEIEHSKKLVEIELHELTQKLFEEVNTMILAEKEEKILIQEQHDKVGQQLKNAETELVNVQLALSQVRTDMTDQDFNSQPQLNNSCSFSSVFSTHENYTLRAQLDMSSLLSDQSQVIEINQEYHQQVHDLDLIAEFKQFTESINSISFSKLLNLPFMKSCLKSDIEPCLRFGLNPKLSSKKILEAIQVKTCLVEPCSRAFLQEKLSQQQQEVVVKVKTRLWDRFSSNGGGNGGNHEFSGCQACGRTIEEDETDCWRFRISYFDEWSIIDRYCYDKIASVMEFFCFLRRLKDGTYKQVDIFILYQACSRLRLQIMGTLSTLLDQFGLDSTKVASSSPELR